MEEAAGYDSIRLTTPYEISILKDIEIEQKMNDHARIHFTGIIPEKNKDEYIKRADFKDKIELAQVKDGKKIRTIFKGQLSFMKIKAVRGIYYIECDGLSNTADMDVKLKSRSFQNEKMSYSSIIKEAISSYPGSDFIDDASKGAQSGGLILQYNETDWQFLKRLASRFNTSITADIESDSPKFYFGIHQGIYHDSFENYNYVQDKSLSKFMEADENYGDTNSYTFEDSDFREFRVISRKILRIGEMVPFKGENYMVKGYKGKMDNGLMTFEYLLSPPWGMYEMPVKNRKIQGISLEGKVIDRSRDRVRVHLNIDDVQQKNEACWFPYSTMYSSEGSGGFYCMPQLGDSVKVYFKTSDERDAVVTGSVRRGQAVSSKMSDPSVKYFGTNYGKELKMGNDDIMLTAKENSMYMQLKEDEIDLVSEKGIKIESDDITLEGKNINIKSGEGLYLVSQNGSIAFEDDVHIKGKKIKEEGTLKLPVKVDEKVEREEEKKQEEKNKKAKERMLDIGQMALGIVGLIPGPIGIAANVINAGISFARGDKAGGILSLICCIPLAGPLLKTLKIGEDAAKGGKLAAAAAKLAVNAGKLLKTSKAARAAAALLGFAVTGAVAIPSVMDAKQQLGKIGSLMDDIMKHGLNAENGEKMILALGNFALDAGRTYIAAKGFRGELKGLKGPFRRKTFREK